MHPMPHRRQNARQPQLIDVPPVDPVHHPREQVPRGGHVAERHAQPVAYRDVVGCGAGGEGAHAEAAVAEGGGGHAA